MAMPGRVAVMAPGVNSPVRTCRRYGVPLELYGDRLNVFVRNDAYWTLAEQNFANPVPTQDWASARRARLFRKRRRLR